MRPPGARRVWIVNHHAAHPDQAAGTRHYSLARELIARGHRVTIFAASQGHHHSGIDRRLRRHQLYRAELADGVRFVWLRTTPYRGNDWRRQVNMLSFLVAFLVVQTREHRPDVIIGSTVHPFAAFGGWLASRLRGARFVFEVRDLWPQTLVDLGALRPGSPGERLLRWIEAFLVRRASAVITLLPGMRDYLKSQSLPTDHVVYLPNGADLAAYDDAYEVMHDEAALPDDTPDEVRACLRQIRRLRAEGRFVLGYLGAFGRVNRADLIADAAGLAESRSPGRVGVVLVGDGPEQTAVERAADSTPAATVCPPIPKRFVPLVLRELNAAVVHTTYTPVYRYGISFNKLFEYMAAARPVVFACETAYDPVRTTKAGVTIEPDSAGRLADAYLELADAPASELAAMGAAGRAYVAREHDIARLGEVLAAVIEARRDGDQVDTGR
jgi:glycosyltransferase involved in cell wall biosynthesis